MAAKAMAVWYGLLLLYATQKTPPQSALLLLQSPDPELTRTPATALRPWLLALCRQSILSGVWPGLQNFRSNLSMSICLHSLPLLSKACTKQLPTCLSLSQAMLAYQPKAAMAGTLTRGLLSLLKTL
eukprot:GHUV01002416.1.p1 GENE.GHUV01002416.1~~GHUV01002416.1.p1  ORF type:complete len:127 (-),score=14.07 GHUV01002416.1:801-1181(-)